MPIRTPKMLAIITITNTIIITLTLIKVLKGRNSQAQWHAPVIPPRVEASLGNLGRSYLKIKTLKGGWGVPLSVLRSWVKFPVPKRGYGPEI